MHVHQESVALEGGGAFMGVNTIVILVHWRGEFVGGQYDSDTGTAPHSLPLSPTRTYILIKRLKKIIILGHLPVHVSWEFLCTTGSTNRTYSLSFYDCD